MRVLLLIVSLLGFVVTCNIAEARQDIPQAAVGCDLLSGKVSENVRAMANNLNVCDDLQHVLQRRSLSIQAQGAISSQAIAPEGAIAPNSAQSQPGDEWAQVLEAQRHISEAIQRATLDLNLVILQSRKTLREDQIARMNAEQRAYRRTKVLNAFLGTTVGAIGSGLQFSNNVSVQHAGDAVSVGGGVITAAFALCTADIDVVDAPPDDVLSQAFLDDNQHHQVPADVWSYIRSDASLREIMAPVATSPKKENKLLSCHLRQAPPNEKGASRERALNALDGKLMLMSRDLAQLSDVTSLR